MLEPRELDHILGALGEVVAADLAVILSVDDADHLRVRAAAGPLARPGLVGREVALANRPRLAAIVRGPHAALVHDEEDHHADEPDTYAGIVELPEAHTCLAAPLRTEGELVGVLTLDSATCRAFSPDQIRAIDAIAGLAADTLHAQQQAERLAREVDTLAALNATLADHTPPGVALVGRAPAWRAVIEKVRLVAPTPATVLITGETGTGKEQIARAIHHWSPRAAGPFVALNCAALAGDLALSELFGHERGAFTGADRRRAGRFELAATGTLFLDEVAELTAPVQAQLLRVLEERTFERVGGAGTALQADVRLITATHKDLESEVRANRFRADLLYRLNAFPVRVPPLRERREDVALLAVHFLKAFSSDFAMPNLELTPAAVRKLETHPWPGNVRELRNTLERAAILANGKRIRPEHLALPDDATPVSTRMVTELPAASGPPRHSPESPPTQVQPSEPVSSDLESKLDPALSRLDRAQALEILKALAESNGKIAGPHGAAYRLGVKPTTLHSKLKRLRLTAPRP